MVNKIYHKLRRLSAKVCARSGIIPAIVGDHCRPKILLYHGICRQEPKRFNTRFLTLKNFNKHIKILKKHCRIVSIRNFFNEYPKIKPGTIAITFDDGYYNNFKYAVPILKANKVPATFFITGIRAVGDDILWADKVDIASKLSPVQTIKVNGHVFVKGPNGDYYEQHSRKRLQKFIKENDCEFKVRVLQIFDKLVSFKEVKKYFDYWKLVTEADIYEASRSPYITIGSHGLLHNNLAVIKYEDACKDIVESKKFLENIIQQPVTSIAYPDGSYSRELIDFCEKQGFKEQLAVDYRHKEDETDRRIINRHDISGIFTTNEQIATVFDWRI